MRSALAGDLRLSFPWTQGTEGERRERQGGPRDVHDRQGGRGRKRNRRLFRPGMDGRADQALEVRFLLSTAQVSTLAVPLNDTKNIEARDRLRRQGHADPRYRPRALRRRRHRQWPNPRQAHVGRPGRADRRRVGRQHGDCGQPRGAASSTRGRLTSSRPARRSATTCCTSARSRSPRARSARSWPIRRPTSRGRSSPRRQRAVDRIAFESLKPGASIVTGGDVNTLDVFNNLTIGGGPGIAIGRDLNWMLDRRQHHRPERLDVPRHPRHRPDLASDQGQRSGRPGGARPGEHRSSTRPARSSSAGPSRPRSWSMARLVGESQFSVAHRQRQLHRHRRGLVRSGRAVGCHRAGRLPVDSTG